MSIPETVSFLHHMQRKSLVEEPNAEIDVIKTELNWIYSTVSALIGGGAHASSEQYQQGDPHRPDPGVATGSAPDTPYPCLSKDLDQE
jgi:hypothetical protein